MTTTGPTGAKLGPYVISSRFGLKQSWGIETYLAHEGYEGLRKALAMTPEDVHQATLAANVIPGSVPYTLYMDRMKDMLVAGGMSAAQASQMAVGQAYQEMLRQASMLSYQNAFLLLSVAILVLAPLPFIMRLPPKTAKLDPEAMGGH